MFVLGHFLKAIAQLLHYVIQLSILLFIVRAILSWVQVDPRQPVVSFIFRLTDPVLNRARKIIPAIGMVDISPIIVIIGLYFLDNFLVPSLYDIGTRMVH
jgi:YggT family protein